MAYPGRQNIYEATIRRMVQQALEQQEQEFREQHKDDTDVELLMYLRACAIRLHHTAFRSYRTPNPDTAAHRWPGMR